ncbi:uncharacterized protein LOC113472053, partial [Diaphorina citri]|uniref:Uncharacterized protein LOC113472053 n=1 Tax=Diaphorina citri TaxID=121845 RepID=A0A3Q0JG24_DIACI
DRVREYTSLIELLQNAAALQREQQAAQRAHALNMIGTEGSELPSDVPGMDQYESSNMMSLPAMPLGSLRKESVTLPKTQQEWMQVAAKFSERWNFPDALGAMDGFHYVLNEISTSVLSDMALCHFKICNMGRKRTSKWTPWLRNENI